MKAAAETETKVGTASGAAPLPQLAAHPAAAAVAANRVINIHKLTCIIRFLFIVDAVVVALVN